MAGATAGLASAAGVGVYGTSVASGVVGNVTAGVTQDAVNGQAPTVGGMAEDAVVGAAAGVVGGAIGSRLSSALDKLSPHQKGKLGEALTTAKEMAMGYIDKGKVPMTLDGRTATGRMRQAVIDHNFRNVFTGQMNAVESKFGFTAKLSKNQRDAKKLGFDFDVHHMTPDSASGTASGTGTGATTAAGDSSASGDYRYP